MSSLFNLKIQFLPGIGPKIAENFHKLGVFSAGDLIYFYPRSYEDWSKTATLSTSVGIKNACVEVEITSPAQSKTVRGGKTLYEVHGNDKNLNPIKITFFGSKYSAEKLKLGQKYILRGNFTKNFFEYQIVSPQIKNSDESIGITPIYRQSGALRSTKISSCIKKALDMLPQEIPDTIPKEIRKTYKLCDLREAIFSIHFPKTLKDAENARKRLIFEEFFAYQISAKMLKKFFRKPTNLKIEKDLTGNFKTFLPFKLVKAQEQAISECLKDMKSKLAMNRLLQGDVGSGKTAVAAGLAFNAAKNGWQTAIMVPTEILARQHYNTFLKFFANSNIKIALLLGATKTREKIELNSQIEKGEIDIVIGTHSLISENVKFKNLGLIVTDEQHRFGVNQRALLTKKGDNPHVLVMSATPIPRTLAMIIYGDLDVSILDETLPGRQTIDTFYVDEDKRNRIFSFLQKLTDEGKQAYIICASIDENERDLENVLNYKEKLINFGFKNDEIEILHGKMKSAEKENIMQRFFENKFKILISTTVVEVGVDVPNAVLIIIENAENFGLAQLHQLRGRVGRGNEKSYCVLISNSKTRDSQARFRAMTSSNNGFYLSEEDLKLRGPGDFFGVNQHGVPNINLPMTYEDIALMKKAGEAAENILKSDPELEDSELKFIKAKIMRQLKDKNEYGRV